MAIAPLSTLIPTIVYEVCQQLYLAPFDNGPHRCDFCYESDEAYIVSGSCTLSGRWSQTGDGWELPYDEVLTDGKGHLDGLTVECRDPMTDSPIAVPDADVDALEKALEAGIALHMEYYPG